MNPTHNNNLPTPLSNRSDGSLPENNYLIHDPSSSIPNPSSLSQNDHRRNILHHLVLLLHAHKCLQRERQQTFTSNGDGPTTTPLNPCTLPHCATMRTVLQHMTKCADLKNCSFHNCVQSRHIILHWKNCVTPNCFLCGSIRKPSALRPQNSLSKEWQQQLQAEHRNHLVKKIVAALLNTVQQDGRSLPPDRLQAITSYAQQTEAETFNSANSQEDYFHRLAERIFKIQKDYEEKQTSKKQMLTTNLSSIDKSAGEQGPPNRIAPQSEFPSSSFPTPQIKSEPSTTPLASASVPPPTSVPPPPATTTNATETSSATTTTPVPTTNTEPEAVVKKEEVSSEVAKIEVKTEKIEVDTNRPPPIDASSKSLPKVPAVFPPEDIREKMGPILNRLWDCEEGIWFRQPVTEAIAPGYFDIIKCPMDFSTIFKKLDENQYATPFQFCEDIWLVFNNAWTFNKKTQRVYKAGLKLSDVFMEAVDPIMKDYGYCCGRQYVFLPPGMYCYGVSGICCTIPRDGDYYFYINTDSSRVNLSGDKYTFCKKCFDSVKSEYILVGDDPSQTLVELPKCEFQQAKNDHQEPEAMVDCIVCSRRFHNICVLHHDHIWPEGYVCKTCVQQYNIKRKENRFLAHKLAMTDLANALETRVNNFLRRECEPDTGRVTIRVLAASDRICEVKPRLKKHFGNQVPDGYPYRTKAVFAFQEIDGIDVVLFGMHVQEYDSRCPGPNARRVYISYLDSVHYFRPKQKRTTLYYELLIGYLEYVKQLGFCYAHIWACPPGEGDDYIFHCHPPEQRVPKPKRLQEWYKTMLDEAINQRVVVDFKDIVKDCQECGITKVSDIPYFEGDFWSSTIEELIKEVDTEEEDRRRFEELEACKASDDGCFDDPIEPEEVSEVSDKRKSGGGTTHKKKNFKKTAARRVARKNVSNGADLMSKLYTLMEKHKESFFVVRLRNPMSNPATLTDTDPLIQCDLMDSRDAFLNFARDKHCEFSSIRRAKYSTMVFLIDLHSSTSDKISYTCNACRQICDVRYHCTVCDDYDLCSKCYSTVKHEHRMDRTDDAQETTTNADAPVNQQQQKQATLQRMVDAIRHAVQCRNANCFVKTCATCQRLLQHVKDCPKGTKNNCSVCNKLASPMWFHAKICTDPNCILPFCAMYKHKLQRQRAATMQLDRRRFAAMHRAKMGPGPSPLNTQNPEPPTPTPTAAQYHPSMESASPSSSGKMMPSGGKGGKQASMSALARTTYPPSMTPSTHPAYYNGGKGHPSAMANSGYPNPMMAAQQPSPWAQQQQQQQQQQLQQQQQQQQQQMPPQTMMARYGTPMTPGGKPMAYNQQRMPYNVDPYMMRQPTPQPAASPAPSPYGYSPSNIAPPGYSHPHAMDPNALAAARAGKPMLPHNQMPSRHPMNSYYPSHPSYMSSYRPMTPNSPPYSMPSNGSPAAVAAGGGKPTLVNPMEMKIEDGMDDPSKLQQQQQQQQQQQMFHPMMQSRPRVPYYPNMQGQVPPGGPPPHPNASYYPSPVPRPNRPKL